jgi:hypothetical protein
MPGRCRLETGQQVVNASHCDRCTSAGASAGGIVAVATRCGLAQVDVLRALTEIAQVVAGIAFCLMQLA